MTIAAAFGRPARPAATRPEPEFGALLFTPRVSLLLGLLTYAAMQFDSARTIWASGGYFDTDDAMRMVQLREWLAGQPWFDASVRRMGTDGFHTHWTHLVDLPLAALFSLFHLGLDADMAERATRIAYPLLTFAATLAALIALARRLVGPAGGLTLAMLAPLSVFAAQYLPGRVDHHGAQLLLLAMMIFALARALDPRHARFGAAAALAAAASLGISVENLPFIAATAVLFGAVVAFDPARARAAVFFGTSFAAATPLVWALFADRSVGPACDALSTFHVALAGLGGLGLAVLAGAAPRLAPAARWTGLAALGAAALALVKLGFPACAADPLAAVPPLATEFWLSRVSEAQPWRAALSGGQTEFALAVGGPILLALCLLLAAARAGLAPAGDEDKATARWRWLALAALTGVGAAATLWQIRAGGSTLIPGLMAAAAAGALAAPFARRGGLSLLIPILAVAPFACVLWPLAAPARPAATASVKGSDDCLTPAALAPLAALPPGLVLTSIDPGSYLLATTRHSVLAGAYHRNARGNVDALSALLAGPDEAQALVRARGVDYVALCADLDDWKLYARSRPGSLAATLLAGGAPGWLEPIAVEGVWRVYRPR